MTFKLKNTYILIQENELFSYYDNFKYLSTIFVLSLKGDLDINQQINQANQVFASIKGVLCNKGIPLELQIKLYNATVINILLLRCKNWALTEYLERKLEVYYHRFLRKSV